MSPECVILLHGLLRKSSSMKKMEKALKSSGYIVINHNYPSTKSTIKTLSNEEIPKSLSQCPEESIIHFVTHSMGGILLRTYLNEHVINNLGKVVMLGPPNQGSQIVDKIGTLPGFKLINGPASLELGTEGIVKSLKPINFDLGIIAGSKSFDFIGSMMLPGPNDGRVSIQSTKVEGMKDHLVMDVTHTFMMRNSKVIKKTIHFLKVGSFN
ncbi:MAG TPA: alpha/beta hydrolase [Sulfurimonas sp.]|nr:alpha/beta hydrolase [Sulfurimonas sp.]